ncbi:unknown [Prevotella sp. CAG:1058]|nr:unknown [Prevotella sp. CAG:1058]
MLSELPLYKNSCAQRKIRTKMRIHAILLTFCKLRNSTNINTNTSSTTSLLSGANTIDFTGKIAIF